MAEEDRGQQFDFASKGAKADYELRYSEDWATALCDAVTGIVVGTDAISFWADCPRCTHQLSDVIFVEEADRKDDHTVAPVVSCNCQSKHEGRPEGSVGCGAYAGLQITLKKDQRPCLDPDIATPEDRRWDELAYKTVTTASEGARSLAQKWSATVATLLSILGVATIIGLFERLIELPQEWRWATAILTGLAVACATSATYLAALAAQGRLRWMKEVTGEKLRKREKETLKDVAGWLDASRILTATAIGIATIVVGIVILVQGEEEGTNASLLVVSDQESAPLCGTPTAGRVGQLTLQPADEAADPVPLSGEEIVTITTVDECP